jgi:hypothetical protein
LELIYCSDFMTFCREKFALFFSFNVDLSDSNIYHKRIIDITNFVVLFSQSLAELKYTPEQKSEFLKNRESYERRNMEQQIKEEIERKEREEFMEQWKQKNKKTSKKSKMN